MLCGQNFARGGILELIILFYSICIELSCINKYILSYVYTEYKQVREKLRGITLRFEKPFLKRISYETHWTIFSIWTK